MRVVARGLDEAAVTDGRASNGWQRCDLVPDVLEFVIGPVRIGYGRCANLAHRRAPESQSVEPRKEGRVVDVHSVKFSQHVRMRSWCDCKLEEHWRRGLGVLFGVSNHVLERGVEGSEQCVLTKKHPSLLEHSFVGSERLDRDGDEGLRAILN